MNWPFSQCRYAFILLVWNRHIVLFKHVCCTHTMTEQASACVDTFTSMFTVTYRRIVCHQRTCQCASPLIRLCVHIKVSTVHAFILLVGSKQDPLLSSSLPRCIWHDSFWCFKTEGPWNGFTVGRERAREEDGERKGETVGGGRQRVRWGEQKDRRKDEKAASIKHDKERDGAKEHQPCVHGGGVNTRPCVHVRCHESLYVSEWRQTKLDVGTIKVWRRLSHVSSQIQTASERSTPNSVYINRFKQRESSQRDGESPSKRSMTYETIRSRGAAAAAEPGASHPSNGTEIRTNH